MRLRTGHNRPKAHMVKKMKLAPSPVCNCGLENQMAEDIMQSCLSVAAIEKKKKKELEISTHSLRFQSSFLPCFSSPLTFSLLNNVCCACDSFNNYNNNN